MRLITDIFTSGHYAYFSEIPERAKEDVKEFKKPRDEIRN